MSELFHWSYYYMKRLKTDNDPLLRAYVLMIWLQMFNCITIIFTINYFFSLPTFHSIFGVPLSKRNIYLWLFSAIVTSPLLILNYHFAYNKQRRKAIEKHYSVLSPKRQAKGKLVFWLYFTFTIVFLLGILFCTEVKRKALRYQERNNIKISVWQVPTQQQSLDSFPYN